jgi:hypothetical protein
MDNQNESVRFLVTENELLFDGGNGRSVSFYPTNASATSVRRNTVRWREREKRQLLPNGRECNERTTNHCSVVGKGEASASTQRTRVQRAYHESLFGCGNGRSVSFSLTDASAMSVRGMHSVSPAQQHPVYHRRLAFRRYRRQAALPTPYQ